MNYLWIINEIDQSRVSKSFPMVHPSWRIWGWVVILAFVPNFRIPRL
jgi:hypothetical protein